MKPCGTKIEYLAGKAGRPKVLIVPLVTRPKPPLQVVSRIDEACDGAVSALLDAGACSVEAGHMAHTTTRGKFRRVVVVSLGPTEKITAAVVQRAAASTTRWLLKEKIADAALWTDGLEGREFPAIGEWAYGTVTGAFSFDEYRKQDSPPPPQVKFTLLSGEPARVRQARAEIDPAIRLAESVNYARQLAHLPPNILNPATLAAEAKRLAQTLKIPCKLIDARQARKLGMGGLLAVGNGAKHPPSLVCLEYKGAPRSGRTVVLVGKSLTFDTGGYSIKPAAGMESMKFDMCGGAAVIGAVRAASALGLRCNVVGILAIAENAVSRDAYRPADILRMMSGKTVEVTNTDAEGRLVLADALTYAQRTYSPTVLINLATLTGGVVTALGKVAAGLMATDDDLAADLEEAGRRANERLWRLPLWDDYRELIKSREADIRNSSDKRDAHPIVGGMFLKEFIEAGQPWAHIDLAGPSSVDGAATGFGVRLLIEYLRK